MSFQLDPSPRFAVRALRQVLATSLIALSSIGWAVAGEPDHDDDEEDRNAIGLWADLPSRAVPAATGVPQRFQDVKARAWFAPGDDDWVGCDRPAKRNKGVRWIRASVDMRSREVSSFQAMIGPGNWVAVPAP